MKRFCAMFLVLCALCLEGMRALLTVPRDACLLGIDALDFDAESIREVVAQRNQDAFRIE